VYEKQQNQQQFWDEFGKIVYRKGLGMLQSAVHGKFRFNSRWTDLPRKFSPNLWKNWFFFELCGHGIFKRVKY